MRRLTLLAKDTDNSTNCGNSNTKSTKDKGFPVIWLRSQEIAGMKTYEVQCLQCSEFRKISANFRHLIVN